MTSKQAPRTRKSYSKGGCRECKRRKIKCDEQKPFCGKCVRLDKQCSYPDPGETVLRVSKKSQRANRNNELSVRQYKPDTDVPKVEPSTEISASNSPIHKLLNTSIVDNDIDFLEQQLYDFEDLDLIASDLNGIVLDMFLTSPKDKTDILLQENNNKEHFNNIDKTGLPIDFINLSPTELRYFQHYYDVVALQMTPFGKYNENLQTYTFPLRDMYVYHAAIEPILKAAILGVGARYYYQRDHLPEDEIAYNSYLSTCLRLLAGELSKRNEKEITSNIEAIILTVLFLTVASALTTNQDWRPHLQGAKYLILKNSNMTSETLIVCKVYISAVEVLAGISSKLGGTMTDEELDKLLTYTDYEMQVLQKHGVILDNGFITICGFHIETWNSVKEYVKLKNKVRIYGDNFVADEPLWYLRIISLLYQQTEIVYHSKDIYLTEYPNSLQLIDTVGDKIVSLMDACQQCYPIAAIITIYRKIFNLAYADPQIQGFVARLVHMIEWVEHKAVNFKESDPLQYASCMVQWPAMVAGENCIKPEHRQTVALFFRLSAQLGSGSAEILLRYLEKVWIKRNSGQEIGADDEIQLDLISF